ncbi:MAG: hypothetical protein Q8L88_12155 [Bacteroidota bacterium]|nr:hypothetical protein [Bacteroidota bacterium]
MGDNEKKSIQYQSIINFLKGREEYALALLLFCAATIACILLYHRDNLSFIYFGDAVSHIVRARQFIDSQQPGLNNIGTVWLPLPHLLLLPFVAFDTLFYSGIAGALIGIPFLVGTGLLLFSIMEIITHSRQIAFFFALLFGLNPNLIYIALTPMNEISLLFFVTLGGFALLKWLQSGDDRWMALCSLAVLSATLCRYEAWLLAPFVSIVALHKGFLLWKQGDKSNAIRLIVIAKTSWLGIIFWFGWNYFQYGDALKFAHWTYSVGTSAVRTSLNDRPQDVFLVFGKAVLWIFGPMLIGASALIVFSIKRLYAIKERLLILIYFSLPALFVLAAILIGLVQIDQWWWNWRFVLPVGLFLSIASAIALLELFQKVRSKIVHVVVVLGCCAIPFVQIAAPSVGVAIFNDASKSFEERSRSAAALGGEIQKRYNGGSIALLTGYGVGQRIMISSYLPLKTFNVIYFSNDTMFTVSDRYVVLGKDRTPESKEFSSYWISNKKTLLRSYNIIMEDNYFVLLERK